MINLKVIVIIVIYTLNTNAFDVNSTTSSNTTNVLSQNQTIIVLKNESTYRLPNNTIPLLYQIKIVTNIHRGDFNFSGEINIHFRAIENTSYITIHKRNITVTNSKLFDSRNNSILTNITFDESTEKLTFHIATKQRIEQFLQGETYTLKINFTSVLGDNGKGFHKLSYMNEEGKEVWLAATHFEPTDARQAFPCYDEPGIRADYDITIVHGKDYHAISNMPVLNKQDHDGNMTATTFERIKSMQAYLVAFVVSDFYYVSRSITTLVPHRVFARPNFILDGNGDLAVIAGEKILTFLEKYFEIKYQFPKMDQVALPLKYGAMENWGLVTYAEELLLYDPKTPGLNHKSHITGVIAHEFTHQFFGNLVAPKWWSYLWLNEGFAEFYQYKITQLIFPEYRLMDVFITDVLQSALSADGLKTTHPMTNYVETPLAISSLFDEIAYQKSASVLRMLEHAVSEKTWKKGLIQYLKHMQYKTATSDDLAFYLDEAVQEDKKMLPSNHNMKDIVNSWSQKSGYPLISVAMGRDRKLKLTQTEFTYNRTVKTSHSTWVIPINVAVANKSVSQFDDTAPLAWMTSDELTLEPSTDIKWNAYSWIVINKQQTGFYRVNYDKKLWSLIIKKLNSESFQDIHHINRAQIINDIFNLARVSKVPYSTAFKLIGYLKRENDFTAWMSAVDELSYIRRLLFTSVHYKYFTKFVQKLIRPLYKKMSIYDKGQFENISDKYLRSIAISTSCAVEDPICIKDVTKRFKQILHNQTADIEPDLRFQIYCQGMKTATKEEFNVVWDRFNKTKIPDVRKTLLYAMGCTKNPILQEKYLKTIIDDTEKVYKKWEKHYVLKAVSVRTLNGLDTTMKFIDTYYKNLTNQFNSVVPIVQTLSLMSEAVASLKQYEAFEKLLDKLISNECIQKDKQTELLQSSKLNLEWISTYSAEVGKYLKSCSNHGINLSISFIFFALLVSLHFIVKID